MRLISPSGCLAHNIVLDSAIYPGREARGSGSTGGHPQSECPESRRHSWPKTTIEAVDLESVLYILVRPLSAMHFIGVLIATTLSRT